jgi:hypothetical protein
MGFLGRDQGCVNLYHRYVTRDLANWVQHGIVPANLSFTKQKAAAEISGMKISVPKERRIHETRVAASPDTVKKFIGLGFDVIVESGAGDGASISDEAFADAGATIAPDRCG